MINTLLINGEELGGIYVDSSLSFNKPGKVVNTYAIPGRNGSLIVDEGTFENVVITFPAYYKEHQGLTFAELWSSLINKLAPLSGYQRIEWAWDPEHYRVGRVIIPQTPNAARLNKDGFFDLAFDCKPQRFLTKGEKSVAFTASGSIINPTAFDSRPLIRVYGSGTATIGDVQVTISTSGTYTDIDCEMMDCYEGATNRNSAVTFSGYDFPVLVPGKSQILLGTGITKIEITPRWWEL